MQMENIESKWKKNIIQSKWKIRNKSKVLQSKWKKNAMKCKTILCRIQRKSQYNWIIIQSKWKIYKANEKGKLHNVNGKDQILQRLTGHTCINNDKDIILNVLDTRFIL
jgi:hypothetical protein